MNRHYREGRTGDAQGEFEASTDSRNVRRLPKTVKGFFHSPKSGITPRIDRVDEPLGVDLAAGPGLPHLGKVPREL